tara:strand:- start:7501 stop:8355 length:855 start_codon:yes stop_codon:yes gene_type:complete
MNQNQLLTQRFNSMSPEMFQGYINNPKTGGQLKAWMQANNYQHPGMLQSSPVNTPVPTVTSNLGMTGPSMQNAYPTAPDTGFKMPLTTTPQAESTGFKGYPYSKPNDMSINAMSADPNYGQFYSQMRNKYNVANTSLPVGSSGMPSVDLASQSASEQAVAESIAKSGTESAGASSLTGPQAFFANMALEAIPTKDRNKVNTPFGDEGSVPGILKGAGKGALLGATIGSAVPVVGTGAGAIAGGVIGGLAGTQGTFDSTSPRQVIAMSTRRPRGGLLQVPKGLYG